MYVTSGLYESSNVIRNKRRVLLTALPCSLVYEWGNLYAEEKITWKRERAESLGEFIYRSDRMDETIIVWSKEENVFEPSNFQKHFYPFTD